MKYETFLRLIKENDRGSGLSRNEIFTRASENYYFELFVLVAMIDDGVKQGDLVVHPHASEPRYSVSSSAKLRLRKEKNETNLKQYIRSAHTVANQAKIGIDKKKSTDWGKVCAILTAVGIIVGLITWYISAKGLIK